VKFSAAGDIGVGNIKLAQTANVDKVFSLSLRPRESLALYKSFNTLWFIAMEIRAVLEFLNNLWG
jgi:hypothetical protein